MTLLNLSNDYLQLVVVVYSDCWSERGRSFVDSFSTKARVITKELTSPLSLWLYLLTIKYIFSWWSFGTTSGLLLFISSTGSHQTHQEIDFKKNKLIAKKYFSLFSMKIEIKEIIDEKLTATGNKNLKTNYFTYFFFAKIIY